MPSLPGDSPAASSALPAALFRADQLRRTWLAKQKGGRQGRRQWSGCRPTTGENAASRPLDRQQACLTLLSDGRKAAGGSGLLPKHAESLFVCISCSCRQTGDRCLKTVVYHCKPAVGNSLGSISFLRDTSTVRAGDFHRQSVSRQSGRHEKVLEGTFYRQASEDARNILF